MKASEVLKRYKAGQRDFRRVNLRGQCFKRQNLSGADFSEADIRSANFTGTNLRGANFTGAKCGLQRRWVILLLILSWLLVGILVGLVREVPEFGQFVEGLVLFGLIISVIAIGTAIGVGFGFVLGLVGLVRFLAGLVGILVGLQLTEQVVEKVVGVESPETILPGTLYVGFGLLLGLLVAAVEGEISFVHYPSVIVFAAIGGSSFHGADLTNANFTRASLKNTDLREANLTCVRWYGAKMLYSVRPGNTYLQDTQVRQWLIGKGTEKNFDGKDLGGINLQGANLADASFIGADLSETNLQYADLSRAKLIETQLDGTNLTGACIKDWIINTNCENIICDYIYLKQYQQERRPSDPSKNFEPGEFAKLVEDYIETVDLIFKEGIDWNAFLTSFQDLRVKYGEQDVSIQAIEKKSDGAFVIGLTVPPDADKGEIESLANESYKTNLKVLEAQYRAELQAKDREITLYKEQGSNMMEIAKLLASRPITVEAKAVAEHQSKNVEVEMNVSGGQVTGMAGKVSGDINVYASEQKQTLAEAADEIQKLLKQLEETNPTATEAEKIEYVNDETSPGFKRRLVGALQAAGDTAIDEFLQRPGVKVVASAVRGWMLP